MNKISSTGSESFRAWVPDFDEWPVSWMGIKEDLTYGQKLLPYFSDFLQADHQMVMIPHETVDVA